jgi:hypothetical protein
LPPTFCSRYEDCNPDPSNACNIRDCIPAGPDEELICVVVTSLGPESCGFVGGPCMTPSCDPAIGCVWTPVAHGTPAVIPGVPGVCCVQGGVLTYRSDLTSCPPPDACENITCGDRKHCENGLCVCNSPYVPSGDNCVECTNNQHCVDQGLSPGCVVCGAGGVCAKQPQLLCNYNGGHGFCTDGICGPCRPHGGPCTADTNCCGNFNCDQDAGTCTKAYAGCLGACSSGEVKCCEGYFCDGNNQCQPNPLP